MNKVTYSKNSLFNNPLVDGSKKTPKGLMVWDKAQDKWVHAEDYIGQAEWN